jgi:hypothetical protein
MRAQYIVPAILAFLFAVLLWVIQKQRLKLEYEVVQSAAFPREGGTGKYFVVRFHNQGNASLNHTEFDIAFDSDVIESSRFANPALVTDLSHSPSRLSGVIPLLNPDESVSVTITTFGQTEAKIPSVVARAPGATAMPRAEGGLSEDVYLLSFGSIAVALLVAGLSFFASYRSTRISDSISKIENLGEVSERIEKSEEDFSNRVKQQLLQLQTQTDEQEKQHHERMRKLQEASEERQRRELRQEQGEPEGHQIIFAIMNRAGLSHRFVELATQNPQLTYWQTGLFLLRNFLIDEANRARYVSVMQSLVDIPNVSPSSRGFNLYMLAKMEQFRGNTEDAIKWFDHCRKQTPLMYEHLMEQDPAYDLEALRQYFKGPQSLGENSS